MISYLKSRKIPLAIGRHYLKEVVYKRDIKTFFALGLENHLGGWELRNKFQKTSSSPKSYTWLRRDKNQLLVVEGMFDLLSLATMHPITVYESDVLVLNSIAFLKDTESLLQTYVTILLYLDNDNAGNSATSKLLQQFDQSIDCSHGYKEYKDMNEKLILWN